MDIFFKGRNKHSNYRQKLLAVPGSSSLFALCLVGIVSTLEVPGMEQIGHDTLFIQ